MKSTIKALCTGAIAMTVNLAVAMEPTSSPWGPEDEIGAVNRLSPELVLKANKLVKTGKVDPQASKKQQIAAAVETNVKNSTRQLASLDPKVEGFNIREGNMLVGAVYELSTGRVRFIDTMTKRVD